MTRFSAFAKQISTTNKFRIVSWPSQLRNKGRFMVCVLPYLPGSEWTAENEIQERKIKSEICFGCERLAQPRGKSKVAISEEVESEEMK